MTRIVEMKILRNEDGDALATKTTPTRSYPEGMEPATIRMYSMRVPESGRGWRPEYKTYPTMRRATEISQLVFEVTDEYGETSELTKRQAKKAYGARQVRKALKRMEQPDKDLVRHDRRIRNTAPELLKDKQSFEQSPEPKMNAAGAEEKVEEEE